VVSPWAPKALYQELMKVSTVAGRLSYFAESPGIGSYGVFNGVLGIALDHSEKYAFAFSADGKSFRRIVLSTNFVESNIARK